MSSQVIGHLKVSYELIKSSIMNIGWSFEVTNYSSHGDKLSFVLLVLLIISLNVTMNSFANTHLFAWYTITVTDCND